jgi:DNA polymerase-3 subunit beta
VRVSCEKNLLIDGLNLVGRAVPARSTMPILECVLLIAEDDGLTLVANDLEMSINTAPIPAEVDEAGSVALEAHLFIEIVRKMPGDYIQIHVENNGMTECRSGRARFKIMGLPGDDFPAINEMEKNAGCTVSSIKLRDMIRQTIFSVALDETKPILTGELIRCRDNSMVIVAVDGFRISYRHTVIEGDFNPMSAVVPAKSLNELSRILPTGENDTVSFFITDKRVVFECDSFTFVSRILEGEFIRYDQIFNEDFTTIVTTERLHLLNALERSVLIARDSKKSPVKLTIDTDMDEQETIAITSSTEMGQSYDEIMCDIDGQNLEIAFNPRYLIDALRAIEEDRVYVKFTTALSPCIVRGVDSDDFKYLVLPLRIRS